ncbi:MAG: hypothetical protein Tsb008_09530 [Rhodothalassiaceae bacterium]
MRRASLAGLALILLAGGYVGLSFFFGRLAEQAVHDQVDALSDLGINVTIDRYERGLLHSHVALTLDLAEFLTSRMQVPATPEVMDGFCALPLEITLRHGPLVFAPTGLYGYAAMRTDLGPAGARILGHAPEEQAISLPLSIRLGKDGTDGRMTLGAISLESDNDMPQLSYKGGHLDFESDNAARVMTLRFESGDFTYANAGLLISVGPMAFDAALERHGERTWLGTQEGRIASLNLINAGTSVLESGEWRFYSDSRLEEDPELFGGESRNVIRRLALYKDGREALVADAVLEGSFEHVSITAMEAFQSAVNRFAQPTDDIDPDTAQAYLDDLAGVLNMAAAHDPVMHVSEISLTHADGKAHFNLDLAFAEGAEIDPNAFPKAVEAIAADGRIEIDQGFLRAIVRGFLVPDPEDGAAVGNMTASLLVQFTANGLFRAEGEKIVSDLTLGNGLFSMNGLPVYDSHALLGNSDIPQE